MADVIQKLEANGFTIEPRRVRKAQALLGSFRPKRLSAHSYTALGMGTANYTTTLGRDEQTGRLVLSCSCPDWRTRGQGLDQPCKHLLALALEIGDIPTLFATPVAPSASATPNADAPPLSFPQQVQQAIASAIAALADQVERLMLAGETPFLLGPTGCGKTSAIRQVATRHGWAFEEVAGSPSFADSDLVGLRTDRMEVPGVFARAFLRAREQGEDVALFIDELSRFNARALDVLMRPLQVTPASIARAMGLAWCDIRLVEAPLWGQDWAPAEKVRIVLAANPWGAQLDPALIRRVYPLPVDFSEQVLGLFDEPVRGAIQASWSAVKSGQLPLPVEYQLLSTAQSPDDQMLFVPYLHKLRALDASAADGFEAILDGLGLHTGRAA